MRNDMMPDQPDDAALVIDDRLPPFCWQALESLTTIRAAFSGARLSTALGIYLTFTEIANSRRSRRGDFRATRKEIAKGAGVSPDTLDRYARDLETLGLLVVIREKAAGDVNLPNRWRLVDPPSRTDAATPSRTGAAQVLQEEERIEEKQPPIVPPLAEVAVLQPANRPASVARKPVTDREYETAAAILAAFNVVAGTAYTATEYITKIIGRLREHPSLTVEAHEVVIRRAFAGPHWWQGPPSPSIVYGNAAHFERCVHAVHVDPDTGAGLSADEIEAQDG